jgi:hypothetical protein
MSETYAARPAQPLADLYGRRLWEVPGIEHPGARTGAISARR